jgi:hypothetical protein
VTKVKKHRTKKVLNADAIRDGFARITPNNRGSIMVAELPGSCAKIHSAIKIRILFFYLSIVRCSLAKENRQLEKLHSTLKGGSGCSLLF